MSAAASADASAATSGARKTWKAENIGFYHSIRHINVNDIDIKVKFLFLMPPPQKKSILNNVVASLYTSYKAYIFASIWPNLKFKCLPERVERIRTLEMKDSSINLKALNRAGGPVERFRALRFTVACTSSKLNCIKYQNHFFAPFPPPLILHQSLSEPKANSEER